MKTVFKIRSTDLSQTMLTKNVSAATVVQIVKSSYGVNYFSAIPTASGRFACPDGGNFSRTCGGVTTIERLVTCYQAPIYEPSNQKKTGGLSVNNTYWELQFSIVADRRYFYPVEVEAEDGGTYATEELKHAWLDSSDVTLQLLSVEGREGFAGDIESMITNFAKMRHQIRHLSSWHGIGIRPHIWCACGHEVARSVANLDPGNKYASDIFAIEQHLCCSKCNEKGKAKLVPVLRVQDGYYSPTQAAYYMGHKEKRARASAAEHDDLSASYEALGSDGSDAAYLSDGIQICPRGHLRED